MLGRPSLAESDRSTLAAAARLADLGEGVRFLSALRRGNVHGALDMGLAPGLLPGRVTLEAGAEWYGDAWGGVPAERGLDAHGILTAASEGRLHGLVLLGADPLADFPDRGLAERALASVGFVVAVDAFLTESSRRADVLLPAAVWGEKTGTATNLEGRVQRLAAKVTAAGVAMADWRIAAELALRLDDDYDLETPDEVLEEIARVAPAYAGVTGVRRAPDGVVVPVEAVPLTVGRRTAGGIGAAPTGDVEVADGEPVLVVDPPGAMPAAADDGGDDPGADGTAGEAETAGPPPLLTWDRRVADAGAPAPDNYALRLVVGRTLYDAGAIVSHGPSLAPLAPGARLRVHPSELERIGVAEGGPVRVTSGRGAATLVVTADPAVPRGVARLAHRQPGTTVDLIDASAAVTDLRPESVQGGAQPTGGH